MIKSPLRYPGGKSRAVDLIASIVPPFDEYREPFIGGGSIFIHLKQKFPNRSFWINDLYFELFKFWEITQQNTGGVIEKVYEWRNLYPVGKELHRFLVDNMLNFNDLERASAFFIFNRITFSGTTESGGFSEQAFHGRFTESSIVRLKEFSKVLPETKITNLDYQEVVNTEGGNVFIFLDPPYYSATKSALYGKRGTLHKGFDHERFAETMKNCKHNWLITYDDSSYIRDLFSFSNIMTWDAVYGMKNVAENSNQIGKELFISNFVNQLPAKKQYDLFDVKVEVF
jgi:DNA adenine methylase